jgi:drug/metabolite transporter (DMT)-like permease
LNTGAPYAGATPWLRVLPAAFVLIWATGFIVARYGMPHAPALGFLAVRFALSIVAFGIWIALVRGVAWPQGRAQWLHLGVAGVLMHAGYLGGVWVAVKAGLGAGLAALIVGLQPLLTALWVNAAGHQRITPRQWLGLALGLAGLVLVVWHKLGHGEAAAANVVAAALALLSITVGTLYQKRWVQPCDVRSANLVQLLAALLVTAPLALWVGGPWHWHPELLGAMAWSVLVLTLGGSSLLMLLIQRGAATTVSSLMYLVPPCTALMAWVLFGETLGPAVLAGLLLAAVGVALVVRSKPASVPA